MATSFSNPVIPGFAPDPSVVRVGDTYFLVNSSFHVFPGIPIYASKNLRNWKHIGNAINRPSQLSLNASVTAKASNADGSTVVATTGLWAPTIRFHNGTFYIICTNGSIDITSQSPQLIPQNFYITSTDIWSNDWSDAINYEWSGIDPSLFFDDDGKVYIQGQWDTNARPVQPTGTIKQAELDTTTGKLISPIREIWPGHTKFDTEGPHIYKKDGWYYLIAAEGGTFEQHQLSAARSRNIWGPYESNPQNPILTAYGKNEYVQNAGHGDFVLDHTGQWWAVVLAIRSGKDGRNTMGRETFLAPVDWPENGWPVVAQPRVEMSFSSEVLAAAEFEAPIAVSPAVEFVYLRNNVPQSYRFGEDFRSVKLAASSADFSARTGTCTFVGKRQRSLETTVFANLHVNPDTVNVEAGLALYKDNYRHAEIFYTPSKPGIAVRYESWRKGNSVLTEAKWDADWPVQDVQFKIEATEDAYTFYYRLSDAEWNHVLELDTLELTSQDFTGPIFGVYAFGEGEVEFSNIDWSC